jgi:hypothetical protein
MTFQKRTQDKSEENIQYATSREWSTPGTILFEVEVSLDACPATAAIGHWPLGAYSLPSVFIRVHPWFQLCFLCFLLFNGIDAN